MLERIGLKKFKSFVDEEVRLAPLTLLVGANAAGKSNLLDAIRFLKGAAFGMTLDEVVAKSGRGGATAWPGIRGGTKEIGYDGATVFEIQSTWTVQDPFTHYVNGVPRSPDSMQMTHVMECRVNDGVHISAEHVFRGLRGSEPLVETDGNEARLGDGSGTQHISSARSVLGQLSASEAMLAT
jgi:hypothetical protein